MRRVHGKLLEQQLVDDGEERGVGSDADRQDQERGQREAAVPSQLSRAKADVLAGVAEPGQRIGIAGTLARERQAAEAAPRLVPGAFRRHAGGEVLGNPLLEMEAGFFLERLVDLPAGERAAQPADPPHDASPLIDSALEA